MPAPRGWRCVLLIAAVSLAAAVRVDDDETPTAAKQLQRHAAQGAHGHSKRPVVAASALEAAEGLRPAAASSASSSGAARHKATPPPKAPAKPADFDEGTAKAIDDLVAKKEAADTLTGTAPGMQAPQWPSEAGMMERVTAPSMWPSANIREAISAAINRQVVAAAPSASDQLPGERKQLQKAERRRMEADAAVTSWVDTAKEKALKDVAAAKEEAKTVLAAAQENDKHEEVVEPPCVLPSEKQPQGAIASEKPKPCRDEAVKELVVASAAGQDGQMFKTDKETALEIAEENADKVADCNTPAVPPGHIPDGPMSAVVKCDNAQIGQEYKNPLTNAPSSEASHPAPQDDALQAAEASANAVAKSAESGADGKAPPPPPHASALQQAEGAEPQVPQADPLQQAEEQERDVEQAAAQQP
eukprot:TRINITY_DN121710_c0_g1_i1.p1 TRINITY_DN121710_c0_g1~~TRINITY_DN121710_c0_g1_i1.p1  ORF type:complete len:438 (-),score=152.33 TRINITY_DN121710_c0_g1_i1:39-1289(-)